MSPSSKTIFRSKSTLDSPKSAFRRKLSLVVPVYKVQTDLTVERRTCKPDRYRSSCRRKNLWGKFEKAQVAQARNMSIGGKPLYGEKTVYIKTHKTAINPWTTQERRNTHFKLGKLFFYWNPFIFVGYRNDRFFSHTNPYILNVTQHCRCSRMLIFWAWATCGKTTRIWKGSLKGFGSVRKPSAHFEWSQPTWGNGYRCWTWPRK